MPDVFRERAQRQLLDAREPRHLTRQLIENMAMCIEQALLQAFSNYDERYGTSSAESSSAEPMSSSSGRAAITSESQSGANFSAGNTNSPWTVMSTEDLQEPSASNCPGLSHRIAPDELGNIAMPEALDFLQRMGSHADHTTAPGDNNGINDLMAAQDSKDDSPDAALLQAWLHTSHSFEGDFDIALMDFQEPAFADDYFEDV